MLVHVVGEGHGANVHHTHIAVKPRCSLRGIGRAGSFAHNVRMTQKGRTTYLREWRKAAGKTLVQVAEYLHMTHGNLSKIERGKQDYNQKLLEALAELYGCEPVDLLIRDPSDPINIWSLWDRAQQGDRQKIVAVARTILGVADEKAA